MGKSSDAGLRIAKCPREMSNTITRRVNSGGVVCFLWTTLEVGTTH